MFNRNRKRISIHDGEPSAPLMGQGHSGRSLRANILPQQDLVRTGEPPKIVVPRRQSTSQRAVFEWGRSPVRRAKAGLGAFLRDARGSVCCGSGTWRGSPTPKSAWRDEWGKKAPSRAFCGAPSKEDSNIRSYRPEMTPKPRPSVVCAAKGNGDEGFRAARKGEGYCRRLCTFSCAALYSRMTKE
jgi:hypothetical protein